MPKEDHRRHRKIKNAKERQKRVKERSKGQRKTKTAKEWPTRLLKANGNEVQTAQKATERPKWLKEIPKGQIKTKLKGQRATKKAKARLNRSKKTKRSKRDQLQILLCCSSQRAQGMACEATFSRKIGDNIKTSILAMKVQASRMIWSPSAEGMAVVKDSCLNENEAGQIRNGQSINIVNWFILVLSWIDSINTSTCMD